MNRLCQTSYGSLEAVITLSGFEDDPEQQLVHFCRERETGKWSIVDVVSINPLSGGSIIQNSTQTRRSQCHGDLEVVVLEEGGKMKHYTGNTSTEKVFREDFWQLSATINGHRDPNHGIIVACDSASLYQSKSSIKSSKGTTLETAILTTDGDIFHYRSPQFGHEIIDKSEKWKLEGTIAVSATGPANIYREIDGVLKALVPHSDGIGEYSFKYGKWSQSCHIRNLEGPACTFIPNPATPSTIYAIGRKKECLRLALQTIPGKWQEQESEMPLPLKVLRYSFHHRMHQGNPMAIVSQSLTTLGHSPNAEAIVFHPSGTGWQDTWMVLHWSYLAASQEWVISGVVKAEVDGMPM
ncbi:hypothetical protein F5B20DRAFT_591019 [Whalleya microplaca]|nr:hypothetical protein F5B20DRAFT_591019 [Whalleya microplaca]